MDHRPVGIQGVVYKDSSYGWHRITEEGEELDRYLFPGEMWGVLRGLDVGLNLEHILLKVPIVGQKKKRSSSLPSPTAKQRLQIKEDVIKENKNSNNFVIAAKNAAKIYAKEEK